MGLIPQHHRHVWIIRHGKSTEGMLGQTDYDRLLNGRGEKDGLSMQIWYSQHPQPAQWVWISTAARAKRSASYVVKGFNATGIDDPNLYLANAHELMSCLQTTPSEILNVAIVAHNPGLTHLANILSNRHVTDNLVTSGSVLLGTDLDWINLAPNCAEFIQLQTPAKIHSTA